MAALAAKPDITLAALARQLRDERGVVVDTSMLPRFFIEKGISFKKNRVSLLTGQAGRGQASDELEAISGKG